MCILMKNQSEEDLNWNPPPLVHMIYTPDSPEKDSDSEDGEEEPETKTPTSTKTNQMESREYISYQYRSTF